MLLSGGATGPATDQQADCHLRPFYSRQQAARTRTGRTPAELATEEACKAYLDQLSAPLAGRNDAAAAAVPALVASTAATPVPVDGAAAVAHTAAVAHSPPPHSSRLELAAASVAAVAAATAAATAVAAAIPAATAIAAANADGPDGPASQDAHPTMRRHLVPSGVPAPAPTTAVRALFAMPHAPVNVVPPTGVRTASALPPAGVPVATAPLLSNADGDGNREARHFGLDAVFCCCRKDQAAPVAEVSEYAPPHPSQEICRG